MRKQAPQFASARLRESLLVLCRRTRSLVRIRVRKLHTLCSGVIAIAELISVARLRCARPCCCPAAGVHDRTWQSNRRACLWRGRR